MKKQINLEVLNQEALELFKKEVLKGDEDRIPRELLNGNDVALLEHLGFITSQKINNDGLLFFGKDIKTVNKGAYIRIARIDLSGQLIPPREDIYECLFLQAKIIEDKLFNSYLPKTTITDGLQRRGESLYPDQALREAIMNAIIHKDYSNPNPIQIKISDSHVRIFNPGGFVEGVDISLITREHDSHARNREILEAFHGCYYVEGLGTGTTTMINDCNTHKVLPPVFQPTSSSVSVSIYLDAKKWLNQNGYTDEVTHKVIDFILEHGSIKRPDVETLSGKGERQSRNYLSDLEGKLLIKEGQSTATTYYLKNDFYILN